MELANQSRIALSGCKLHDLQAERATVTHLGFNARYHILIEGSYEQLLRRSFFEDIISIKLYQNTGTTHFHGELLTLTQQYIKHNAWTWQLELGCSLHRLDNESGHHSFVDNTVQDIIEALFEQSAIACQFDIKAAMPKLPYTAQGGVSDYDFLMRLCVEHGLVFFYRHEPAGAQLYLTDEPKVFQRHPLEYNPEARHFINEVVKNGIPDNSSYINGYYTRSIGTPRIGAMILFDTVVSLGIPGTAVTMGFNLGIPSQVENVLHITANDEHRAFFPLHSVIDNSKPQDSHIVEIGLPGAHADIGGGYPNPYSKIAFNLAYNYLRKLNVPLKSIGSSKAPSLDDPSLRLHDSRYMSDKLWQNGKKIVGIRIIVKYITFIISRS